MQLDTPIVTETLNTVAALLAVVGGVAWIAARLQFPPPILLVLAGMALAFMPWLPAVELDPDLVLLVLLPPLIYFAAFTMSWQAFCANLRPILLLAFGCVVVTTVAVAGVAHWLLTLPLGVAFMLGAIVSPPDVVAPLAVAERLSIPRRIVQVVSRDIVLSVDCVKHADQNRAGCAARRSMRIDVTGPWVPCLRSAR